MMMVFSVPVVVSDMTGTGGRNVAMEASAVELGRLPNPSLPNENQIKDHFTSARKMHATCGSIALWTTTCACQII